MSEDHDGLHGEPPYPVVVSIHPATEGRNRLTTALRFFLALPHIFLVGGPVVIVSSVGWGTEGSWSWGGGAGGFLGVIVGFTAFIAWLVIIVTARHPDALWRFAAFYLRWRLRVVAYMTLLRDEYPPFGDGDYPAQLRVSAPDGRRHRLSVAFRLILAIPHLIVLALLSVAWSFATAVAWIVIIVTGRFPETLYGFAIGVLAWTMRVEAYLLLLRDEYPPFTLRV